MIHNILFYPQNIVKFDPSGPLFCIKMLLTILSLIIHELIMIMTMFTINGKFQLSVRSSDITYQIFHAIAISAGSSNFPHSVCAPRFHGNTI